jgi:hypothetical protein
MIPVEHIIPQPPIEPKKIHRAPLRKSRTWPPDLWKTAWCPKVTKKDIENWHAYVEATLKEYGHTRTKSTFLEWAISDSRMIFRKTRDAEIRSLLLEARARWTSPALLPACDNAGEPDNPARRPDGGIDWEGLLLSPPLSAAEVAEILGEPVDGVERTLRYFRNSHDYGFVRDDDNGFGESRFRYKMPDVLAHLQKWHAKRQKKAVRNSMFPND